MSASTRSAFVSDDEPVTDVEQLEDLRVLLGLRHPALVRGDDEQRDLDRADAREHVLHEADVTGHVDEPDDVAPRAAS